MNFFSIIIYGYIIVAAILIYFLFRDQRDKARFFGQYKIVAWLIISILILGIITALYTRFVEPFYININNTPITLFTKNKLSQQIKGIDPVFAPRLGNVPPLADHLLSPASQIKIVLITDIQIGNHKKTDWMKKIVKKIEKINPDLIIFGGDLIDNEGIFEDESQYLEPLKKLVGKYQMYYILGNHEYGIGSAVKTASMYWTGDRSIELMARMEKIGIPLLRDTLTCPLIKEQKICLYGIDDIWYKQPTFSQLPSTTTSTPLIFLTHNPDGILYWPKNKQKPDLVLSGHSHGGQIWLPFIGPLGNPGIGLGVKYYKSLNYYNNIPIFTSTGIGESGGPVRLFVPPEIVVLELWF
jgi:hypothetical protein